MAEKLSWDEITHRYPDEWVVLVDYALDEDEQLTAGVVYAHSRDKADLRTAMAEPHDAAVVFTGEPMAVAGMLVEMDPE